MERTTRLNLLGDLPDRHGAESVLSCPIGLFERVPSSMRRTLTWVPGREMARHDELAGAVDIDVYIAEPHHSWQRGSNENFNDLVRRYVGKGTNRSAYSQQDLDRISLRINAMPRRLHRWESAKDRYDAVVVALTARSRPALRCPIESSMTSRRNRSSRRLLGPPPGGDSQRLSRIFTQRDYAMVDSVSRRRSSRLWAAHTNPSVTIGLRS